MPLQQVNAGHFNSNAQLPYGLEVHHVRDAMNSYLDFLGFINDQLVTKKIEPLETMLMPANFSSIVGEFMSSSIPKFCPTIVKNAYHNGHPDLIPAGKFPKDMCQHGVDGIEIKGSRYLSGWQGHNAEACFLMVFCFESGRPTDQAKGIAHKDFRFLKVCAAQLEESDWQFAGRSETSRRTITATVKPSGYAKMMSNWVYKAPGI